MAMGIRRVVVNVPFKVAGGRYYSQAGVVESMPQEIIDRALKVNPNMITVLPMEETEQEKVETIEDAELEEKDKPTKTAKKKKDEE